MIYTENTKNSFYRKWTCCHIQVMIYFRQTLVKKVKKTISSQLFLFSHLFRGKNKEDSPLKTASNQLTQGPVAKGLISFSLPILFSNLLQQVYNSADSAILGRFVGSDALAAAGSVGSLFNLLVGFSLGLAVGVNILYAIVYGAGDREQLRRIIGSALILSVLAATLIAIPGTVFADGLLQLVNTPKDIWVPSRRYLTILASGVITTLLYNVGAGILRAEGDSLRPLLYLGIGGMANIVLDLLFVVRFQLGISSAAWATVLAQGVTAVLVLHRLTKLDSAYSLTLQSLRFDRRVMMKLLELSIPCGLQSSMFNISNLLVQTKINTFGSAIMAGYTAYCKVDSFVYMPIFAFSSAISTFVGQNKGACHYTRMRCGIRICTVMTMLITGLLAAGILLFTAPLLRLFTRDPVAIDFGIRMAAYLMPFVAIYSISDILGGAIRGFGESAPVTAISVCCICIFRIIWLEGVFRLYPSEEIVFLCYPISWLLCVAAVIWFYYRHSKVYHTIRNTCT